MAEQAVSAQWFILARRVGGVVQVQQDDDLKLPLDWTPLHITRLTVTRVVGRGQLSIVASSNEEDDLLLHESEKPSEPNNPNIFFLASVFQPDAAAAADGRNVFDFHVKRLLNRDPGLPHFSGVRNVGFLSLRGDRCRCVVAELQAANRQADNNVPFVTLRHHKPNDDDDDAWMWEWEQTVLTWPVVDDAANPHWTTHDVLAHDKKLWWVNLSRGLVVCDPVPAEQLQPRLEFVPLPVLTGYEDRHEPPSQIDRYRIVGVSAGEMRFVDVARRRNHPAGETRVAVWTLGLPAVIANATWRNNPRKTTTLADIWNSAKYVAEMPRGRVPVVALVHPNQPAVVYFFLDQYVFAVNVNQGAVLDVAVMPAYYQDGVPRPINQRDVLPWKSPPFKLLPLQVVYEYEKSLPVQQG